MVDDEPLDSPLLRAWARFVDADPTPFATPGHKRRAGLLDPRLGRLLDSDVPLYAGIGSVKGAVADLRRAEEVAATGWSADWCRYNVGGTTQTNQTAVLGVTEPGDTVLVARNSHRSIVSALALAGVDPVWLRVDLDERTGLPLGVSEATLRRALAEHPGAAAVLLVEPSYVGTLSDRRALFAAAHETEAVVVVDQAWGGHLGFHPDYPEHALAAGADLVTFSAHKTLPAYTQASVMLARAGRIDLHRLQRTLEAVETTSPAGSTLASIDASCALLRSPRAADLLGRLAAVVAAARERLEGELPGVHCPGPDDFSVGRFDPAKLVILWAAAGLDGLAIEQDLVAAAIPLEQTDRDTTIALAAMMDDAETLELLTTAIVDSARRQTPAPRSSPGWRLPEPVVARPPREAFFAATETVAADRARGRVSAEVIAPYPPGIPVLAPGELITDEVMSILLDTRDRGVRIGYAADPTLGSFLVLAEQDAGRVS